MLKSKKLLALSVVLFALFLFSLPSQVSAREDCSAKGITITSSNANSTFNYPDPVVLNISLGTSGIPGLVPNGGYHLRAQQGNFYVNSSVQHASASKEISWNGFTALDKPGTNTIILYSEAVDTNGLGADGCRLATYEVSVANIDCEYLRVAKSWTAAPSNGNLCYADATHCVESGILGSNLRVSARLRRRDGTLYTEPVFFSLSGPGNAGNDEAVAFNNGDQEYHHNGWSPDHQGTYTVTVKLNGQGLSNPAICQGTFTQQNNCDQCLAQNNIAVQLADPNSAEHYTYRICDQISDSLDGGAAKQSCIDCVGGELGREGIWTAVGCIPRSPEKIVNSLLRIGLGVGGGFSLIIILVSGFILSVSQGEPKRIDEAKQWLTSALVGLLFIIFSVTLLHFIGYTIFRIPGFGG